MNNWLDRSGEVAIFVLAAGAITGVVALIILLFLLGGDGENDDGSAVADPSPTVRATATATVTAGAPTPTPTLGPTATATPASFTDEFQALEAFVRGELDAEFAGVCPEPDRPKPAGVCFQQLYRSDEQVTFFLNRAGSLAGEAVLTRITASDVWTLLFVEAAASGAHLTIDSGAVVFGVGDCLIIRAEPSTGAEFVDCVIDGTERRVMDGPENADGVTWWQLEELGWANEEFLTPAGE
ncbi:MAG: hypothetical protein U1B78_00960 [Dehalococcoidia bacterium]|nr:hypothetical protein [Dehalococcoidia bacterium]